MSETAQVIAQRMISRCLCEQAADGVEQGAVQIAAWTRDADRKAAAHHARCGRRLDKPCSDVLGADHRLRGRFTLRRPSA